MPYTATQTTTTNPMLNTPKLCQIKASVKRSMQRTWYGNIVGDRKPCRNLKLMKLFQPTLSPFFQSSHALKHRCASYTHKKQKGRTVFWQNARKTFGPFRKRGLEGSTQILCDHHGLSFMPPFCHLSGHVCTKEFI